MIPSKGHTGTGAVAEVLILVRTVRVSLGVVADPLQGLGASTQRGGGGIDQH